MGWKSKQRHAHNKFPLACLTNSPTKTGFISIDLCDLKFSEMVILENIFSYITIQNNLKLKLKLGIGVPRFASRS